MENQRFAHIVSIICILMMPIGQIGIDIYTPAMPAMVSALHTSASAIQLTVTLYTIGLSLALLATGPIIDSAGRYSSLIIGMSVYTLAALFSTLSSTIESLLVLRVLQGIGAGITITSSRACMADCFTGEALARVFANMAIVWSLGPVLAPFIGGYLTHFFHWQANFAFMGIYGAIILFFTITMLGETLPETKRQAINSKRIAHNFKRILSSREFIAYIFVMTTSYGYIILFNVAAPFILQTRFGFTPIQFGKILLFVGVCQVVSNLINKRMILFYDRQILILGAVIVSIIACALQLALSYFDPGNIYVVLIPTMVIISAIGFIYANCVSKTVALFPDIAGANSSLIGFIPMIGCAGAAVVATKLPHGEIMPVAAVSLIGYSLALIIFLLLRKTTNN